MTEKQRRYKFGDSILRERKGRYYVYKLEYENGNSKERYVGPLTDVVETYEKLKEIGGVGVPHYGAAGFEPGTTSVLVVRELSPGWHPTKLDYGPDF